MTEPFTPREEVAWGGLLHLMGRLMRLIDEDLQENSRLTHVEFEVLLRLSWEENQRLRIQDLATRSVLTRSGISRVVERLEEAGLVIREKAPEDRRGAYAILTEAGLERFKKAEQHHIAFVRDHFLKFFTPDEQTLLGDFWQRLAE